VTTAACPLVFSADAHVYRLNNIVVPSVTQVLRATRYIRLVEDIAEKAEQKAITWVEALVLMEKRLRVLEVARKRGSDIHALLQYLVEDDLDESSIDPAYAGYIESGRLYVQQHVKQPYRAEFRVWSRHGYAGTLDLFALHHDGFLSIDDFKSGDVEMVASNLQLAAYLGAVLEMRATDPELDAIIRSVKAPVIRRRAIRLRKDGRIAQETMYSDPRDYSMFLNALSVVNDQARQPAQPIAWGDER